MRASMLCLQFGHARIRERGWVGVGAGWAWLGHGGTWVELELERFWVFLRAAFWRTLLMARSFQGKNCFGQKGPRRILVGRLWELEFFPPIVHKALWRPLAAHPSIAILALIMGIKVVTPYARRGLALERIGARRGLSWALTKNNSCFEFLMKAL